MRSKIVETLGVDYASDPRRSSSSTTVVSSSGGSDEPDGFEILNRVRDQLDSMNSGKLRAAMGVMDAASKVRYRFDKDPLRLH